MNRHFQLTRSDCQGLFCAIAFLSVLWTAAGSVHAAAWLGPNAIAASPDGTHLFVAETDAKQVVVIDLASHKVVGSVATVGEPTGMVFDCPRQRLYVTCAAPQSIVAAVDPVGLKIVATFPAGHTAMSPVLSPDGRRLYVSNRFDNDVSVIDLTSGKTLARIPAVREPCAAVVTPDGRSVFVANLLPLERSDDPDVAAVVTVIDTGSLKTTAIRLPNGSSSVRGISVSPDGKYVYVVHGLARYQMPTTQVDRGWMNTNAMSLIDARARKLINTVLLDDVDRGAANPWGVTTTADGKTLCVSHAGTHELSLIDAPALMTKLSQVVTGKGQQPPSAGYGPSISSAAADVPNDLAFLVGLRRGIRLPGNGPRGLLVLGSTIYVSQYFSDSLAVVDVAAKGPEPAGQIALGPSPQPTVERRGQMLFHDATICFQHWQSCATCHPDARVDGLNWDLLNDGLGNPKNTRSMLLAHSGGPAMSLGIRDSAEAAVRAGLTRILFAARGEDDARAIDQYLKSLVPVPSPRLVAGQLSPAVQRGKKIFFEAKVDCARCHSEPYYSDKKSHDVGSGNRSDKPGTRFNTPRLIEAWRTAPYLHDGHWLSIQELLIEGRHGLQAPDTRKLSPQEIDDLAEFVLSL